MPKMTLEFRHDGEQVCAVIPEDEVKGYKEDFIITGPFWLMRVTFRWAHFFTLLSQLKRSNCG